MYNNVNNWNFFSVSKLLEQAIDLEIDVPKVWEYYGEQLAPIFVDDDIKMDFGKLGELAKPLVEENKGGIFVVKVLKAMEGYIVCFNLITNILIYILIYLFLVQRIRVGEI